MYHYQYNPHRRSSGSLEFDPNTLKLVRKSTKKRKSCCHTFIMNPFMNLIYTLLGLFVACLIIVFVYQMQSGSVDIIEKQRKTLSARAAIIQRQETKLQELTDRHNAKWTEIMSSQDEVTGRDETDWLEIKRRHPEVMSHQKAERTDLMRDQLEERKGLELAERQDALVAMSSGYVEEMAQFYNPQYEKLRKEFFE